MSQRILRKQLQNKVDYLSKRLNCDFAIDHYSPGGNPYTYKLVEQTLARWVRGTRNYKLSYDNT